MILKQNIVIKRDTVTLKGIDLIFQTTISEVIAQISQ